MSWFRRFKLVSLGLSVAAGLLLMSGVALAFTGAPTLRLYAVPSVAPGDFFALDPASGEAPQDRPYTGIPGLNSIFDPTGPQAPGQDSLTWNPAWLYANETVDENQTMGLYRQILSDDVQVSEKVWLRMWYEPGHVDRGIHVADTPTDTYPALMQEVTYMLMEAPDFATLSDSWPPRPAAGPAGHTQFVFPIGIGTADMDDTAGYGLTSFDGDFDNVPDIVQVDSEASLVAKTGIPDLDFNQNGVQDPLDQDAALLSGDELVVFSLAPRWLEPGQRLQFLDRSVQVAAITTGVVTVQISYLGDLLPIDQGVQDLAEGELWTGNRRLSQNSGDSTQTGLDLGPFYVQAVHVDAGSQIAQLRIGRALGAPYAAAGAGNGDLKRFYVDGHQYNVVAIGTKGTDSFRFITLRTPLPASQETIAIIPGANLQSYAANVQLTVPPPFNQEHYFTKDIQRTHTGKLIGEVIGPVPPVLSKDAKGYWGAYHPRQTVDYEQLSAMRFRYVRQGANPAQAADPAAPTTDYLELLLPDIPGADDLFVLTSAFASGNTLDKRIQFWFDPGASAPLQQAPGSLSLYGIDGQGAGDSSVVEDSAGYPVEIFPHTNAAGPAPTDLLTFSPARLGGELSCNLDPLRDSLYPLLSLDTETVPQTSENVPAPGHVEASLRMWYEPNHLDLILLTRLGVDVELRYPALMQEYTYQYLDASGAPTATLPGAGTFPFPVGATAGELDSPRGYGLTTFDADLDGVHDDVVRVHSERSLAELTSIQADFDGDGQLDDLDSNGLPDGDELVIFAVEQLTLTAPSEARGSQRAVFLDHGVQLVDVSGPRARIQILNLGGGLQPTADREYRLTPQTVGPVLAVASGDMVIAGRNKLQVIQLSAGDDNLGSVDGPWFVHVSEIHPQTGQVVVTIGRALGATHSALFDRQGRHDLAAGDPGYLKRFYVDGHEYNVVLIDTIAVPDAWGFSGITIRTPTPQRDFANARDGQLLQGFEAKSGRPATLGIMPPFNLKCYTVAEGRNGQRPDDTNTCRAGLQIEVAKLATNPSFTGELAGILFTENEFATTSDELSWRNLTFGSAPSNYISLVLPDKQTYRLTGTWNWPTLGRWTASYAPGNEAEDVYINTDRFRPAKAQGDQGTAQCRISYTVRAGDTLTSIGVRYGVSAEQIVEANRLRNPSLLYAGQRLVIPLDQCP